VCGRPSLRAARALPGDAVRADAHLLSVQRRAHLDREALPNVWVDLCWAWSINPYSATDFVLRFLPPYPSTSSSRTAATPAGRRRPLRMRRRRARPGARARGRGRRRDLTERQAIAVAHRVMRDNSTPASTSKGHGRPSTARRAEVRRRRASARVLDRGTTLPSRRCTSTTD